MAHSQQEPQPEISSPDSISACSSVLEIPELLEDILAQLPARDLLMCECISKTWHATIKKSNILQEKLFYNCDLVPLGYDVHESDLEINPFFLLVQRRWALAARAWRDGYSLDSLRGLAYPEASWQKMYLSRPAIYRISIGKNIREEMNSGSSVQIIQHGTIKMNHLQDSRRWPIRNVCFSQTGGIRMHHLSEWDLTRIFFLKSSEDESMEPIIDWPEVPIRCPRISLSNFIDMYECQEKLKK